MNCFKSTASLLVVFLEIFCVISEKLPSDISERLYCEGCSATVKGKKYILYFIAELIKKVNKKSGDSLEVRVIEALEDICNNMNFRSYDFSPPSTAKACKLLLERHEEEIELLMQKNSVVDKEKAICYELSKACEGVDRSQKPKEPMDVRINDKKQTMQQGDDGINRMNVDINDPNAAQRLADQIKQQMNLNQEAGGGEQDEDDEEEEEESDAERPAPAQGGEDGQRVLSVEELEKLAKEEEDAEKAEKEKAKGQDEKSKETLEEEKEELKNSNKKEKTEL